MWSLRAIEAGVGPSVLPGVVTGGIRIGNNSLDPVTILTTIDGATGYFAGIGGSFNPLEPAGSPVAITDDYLFWNGVRSCTGFSTALGIFVLGELVGAGSLIGSPCVDAIEHGGTLYVALADSGVVVTFDVVQAIPALGPVGSGALVLLLVATAARLSADSHRRRR